uniref:Putative gene regulator n=1 Tax=Bacillus phage Lima TaxID=1260284 RepID=K7X6R4_9VIRU|nr:putative gene regulator [Bacillus phage Lima]
MRDKLLDFIIELSQSSKQVVAKDYVIDRLMQVTKEDYKEMEKKTEGKKN